MKKIKYFALLSIAVIAFSSCEKVVDVKLPVSESKPVVEGLVADTVGMSYVRLTRSGSYLNVQQLPGISNAVVEVTDNHGITTVFHETAAGYYEPSPGFKGMTGNTYNLKVTLDGTVLTSSAIMRPVTPIESIRTEFFDDNNSEGREKGYYVFVSFYELPGPGDSYKIDMYVNGTSNVKRPNDLFCFNDKYVDGGHAVDWGFTQKVEKNDAVVLKMYSLSQDGYKFYDALYQTANAGGFFGKNPANVPGNIHGNAFGYFGASAVSTKSVVVQ